jgi:hypothetical protein
MLNPQQPRTPEDAVEVIQQQCRHLVELEARVEDEGLGRELRETATLGTTGSHVRYGREPTYVATLELAPSP